MRFSPSLGIGLIIGTFALALPAPTLAEDPPEVQAQRRALNETQADLAAAQMAEHEARKAVIEAQQATAETSYRHAMGRHDARVAAMKAQAEQSRAQWRADVTLCRAGELARCEPVGGEAGSTRVKPGE